MSSPAITDANLVLGRLLPSHFPAIFGESEDQELDVEASREALERLRKEINEETGSRMSLDEIAYGFIRVANETMYVLPPFLSLLLFPRLLASGQTLMGCDCRCTGAAPSGLSPSREATTRASTSSAALVALEVSMRAH